ncbi:hypothetical protein C8Q77DRAFT_550936 [Trametes polyzona]|nr:hypothetical protein C8Q77DRAFT_550936 [Trametes polyzona]
MASPVRALSPGSSLSSYGYFSHSRSGSRDTSASSGDSDESYGTVSDDVSSDDEIVLSFSDISTLDVLSQRGEGPRSPAMFSDDEFVIMSRPRTPRDREDDLAASFSALSVSTTSRRSQKQSGASNSSSKSTSPSPKAARRRVKKKRSAAGAPSNPPASSKPSAPTVSAKPSKASLKSHSPSKARRRAKRAAEREAVAGLGDRPIVDDVSEVGSEYPAVYVPPSVYETAQSYVSSVLSADPSAKSRVPKLAFLQALIIELGLYPADPSQTNVATPSSIFSLPSLPNSMRAAKALLKSQVFLNVRDYLAVRSQGIDALRSVMHPSRSALLRDIRGGRKAPVKSVKESGLSVLLVTCYR